MNSALLPSLFSLACPWLALVRALQILAARQFRQRGWMRLAVFGVAAIGLLAIPISGHALAGWMRGIEVNFSIPLTVLLAAAVWENEFSRTLLKREEKRWCWAFGFLAGLLLYPLALGLGNIDPYEWGWRFSPLFAVIGILTVWVLWRRNRFGIVLLLAAFAYNLRLLESNNYWDYLLDPVYFVASMISLASVPFNRLAGKSA